MEMADPESTDCVVSGRLALRQDAPIQSGEPHVIMTWPLARQGNACRAAAAIFSAEGKVKRAK